LDAKCDRNVVGLATRLLWGKSSIYLLFIVSLLDFGAAFGSGGGGGGDSDGGVPVWNEARYNLQLASNICTEMHNMISKKKNGLPVKLKPAACNHLYYTINCMHSM
jgi:hypothetical protein